MSRLRTLFRTPSQMVMIWAAALLACVAFFPAKVYGCTSTMAGPEATADGSVWVGQSDDGEGADDSRLVWVPPMDWPSGSQRPIIDYGVFPRYVGTERKLAVCPSARSALHFVLLLARP